ESPAIRQGPAAAGAGTPEAAGEAGRRPRRYVQRRAPPGPGLPGRGTANRRGAAVRGGVEGHQSPLRGWYAPGLPPHDRTGRGVRRRRQTGPRGGAVGRGAARVPQALSRGGLWVAERGWPHPAHAEEVRRRREATARKPGGLREGGAGRLATV